MAQNPFRSSTHRSSRFSFFRSLRVIILSGSLGLSLLLLVWIKNTVAAGDAQTIKLTQSYALIALFFLYVTLLISPFTQAFPKFPFKNELVTARRSLGISAFYFGLLHALCAFFGQLGGFEGLAFLDVSYLVAITLSFIALLILTVLAATSFEFIVKKMGYKRWKMLHRFVYLAGVLILLHSFMLGSHFSDFSGPIAQIWLLALTLLFILEALRIDRFLIKKYPRLPRFGFATLIMVSIIAGLGSFNLFSSTTDLSFNVHAQHLQLALQASQNNSTSSLPGNLTIPGLNGDRTRRFTVSFLHNPVIEPHQKTNLRFEIFDASNGRQIVAYQKIYEKLLHLIVVDEKLQSFQHLHPTLEDKDFVMAMNFPHDGIYHLYLNFQPIGAIEQQFAFTVTVGSPHQQLSSSPSSTPPPDQNLIKTFGGYEIQLKAPQPLQASLLSIGQQKITFLLRDAKTHKPIQTLQPYLGAFGHLTLIDENTFDYVHVHPTNIYPPAGDAHGGPNVEFMPLGLYGPIKAGIYNVFAEFNPDGHLLTADYTLTVTP